MDALMLRGYGYQWATRSVILVPVIPAFDYMDVVGRATQEAKAESQYPLHNTINTRHSRVDWNPVTTCRYTRESGYPVNYWTSLILFGFCFASMARYFFLACPRNEVPKKKRHPWYHILRIPSSVSSAHGHAPTWLPVMEALICTSCAGNPITAAFLGTIKGGLKNPHDQSGMFIKIGLSLAIASQY